MNYLANVKDLGVILSPDGEGERMHPWDGGGIREAVITVDDSQPGAPVYYLSYDGAMPGKTHESYWNACSARSRDLLRWEKLGPTLRSRISAPPARPGISGRGIGGTATTWGPTTAPGMEPRPSATPHCWLPPTAPAAHGKNSATVPGARSGSASRRGHRGAGTMPLPRRGR